eukprot:GHVU01152041.1.p2 GENE.GHVU01152041.1~~GHVU01152041.1.p2  ORF type:complete len:121 (+),score=13.02 GHVU01152041.1:187-549(+)
MSPTPSHGHGPRLKTAPVAWPPAKWRLLTMPACGSRSVAPRSGRTEDGCRTATHHLGTVGGAVVGSGSEIAQREGLHHSTVNELLHLTLLEPAIIQSILAGQQPKCMSLLWFQRNPLPTD